MTEQRLEWNSQTGPPEPRGKRASPVAVGMLSLFLLGTVASCRSTASGDPLLALSGPVYFVPGFGLYTISGNVKNSGTATARSVKVTATIYPGALTAWTITNPADLASGASGSFAIAFSDHDMSIRNGILKDATQFTFEYER